MKKIAMLFTVAIAGLCMAPIVEGAFGESWRDTPITAGAPPPKLISPTDGAVFTTGVITLQWENQAPASNYYLQIDDSSDFSSPNYEYSEITATQKTVSLAAGTWYWRVRQYRQTPGVTFGAWTNWSEVRSFTVQAEGQRAATSLSIQPFTFELLSGGSKTLTAVLTSDGSPVSGKTISWSATQGSLSPQSATTDSNGRATVTFTAPETDTSIEVRISASFSGDASYAESSAQATATIVPLTPKSLSERVREAMVSLGFENAELADEVGLLENAFSAQQIGGVVNLVGNTLERVYRHPSVEDVSVIEVKARERVKLELRATGGGRSFVLNISKETLASVSKVLVDGNEITKASSYADALDPSDENEPEFFVLEGRAGLQVVLSIPSFSTRTVVLLGPGEPSLLWLAAGAAVVLVLVFVAIARAGRKRAPPGAARPSAPTPQQPAQPVSQPQEAAPPAALKCPACGKENSPRAKFCGYCGHRLAGES